MHAREHFNDSQKGIFKYVIKVLLFFCVGIQFSVFFLVEIVDEIEYFENFESLENSLAK